MVTIVFFLAPDENNAVRRKEQVNVSNVVKVEHFERAGNVLLTVSNIIQDIII